MLPLCAEGSIGVLQWSPLARGRLTRDWNVETDRARSDEFGANLYPDTDREVVAAVARVAAARGLPRAAVAPAWLRHKPAITAPIVGVLKEKHLVDAVASLDVDLDHDEIPELESAYLPHEAMPLA